MQTPINLTEDEVKAASQGRSEQIMVAPNRPVDLAEDEVKAASEGRSEQIMMAKTIKSDQT